MNNLRLNGLPETAPISAFGSMGAAFICTLMSSGTTSVGIPADVEIGDVLKSNVSIERKLLDATSPYVVKSEVVVVRAFNSDLGEQLIGLFRELSEKQESLGEEFEMILQDNIWDLYIEA